MRVCALLFHSLFVMMGSLSLLTMMCHSASVSLSSDGDSTASSTRPARAAMKTFTIVAAVAVVALVACLVPSSQATPVALSPGGPEGEDAELVPAPFVEERANRQARATCDLLSFTSKWVSVNHSACAAHCLGMLKGFKGGRCENAICVCRK